MTKQLSKIRKNNKALNLALILKKDSNEKLLKF